MDASILAIAWSMVKLAAFCRGGKFLNERRSFALRYRCEHPDGRSPRMLVRRQRDEGIRGLLRTLQYHPTKPLNLAQQLHLGQVS
jgi:hypothetical protein